MMQICNPVFLASVGSDVLGFTAKQFIDQFTSFTVQSANWMIQYLGEMITTTSTPQLTASFFGSILRTMAGICSIIILPLIMISVIQGVFTGDFRSLIKLVLQHMPLALAGTGIAVAITEMCVEGTDEISNVFLSTMGSTFDKGLSQFTSLSINPTSGLSEGAPVIVVALLSVMLLLASTLLFVEMIMRGAAIEVAVIFFPLALAGIVWPATSHWIKRLIEIIASLIISKFVIIVVLTLAEAQLLDSSDPLKNELLAVATLWLAVFSPFVVFRIIPFVESSTVSGFNEIHDRFKNKAGATTKALAGQGIDSLYSASPLNAASGQIPVNSPLNNLSTDISSSPVKSELLPIDNIANDFHRRKQIHSEIESVEKVSDRD